jgi:hypothetical protein
MFVSSFGDTLLCSASIQENFVVRTILNREKCITDLYQRIIDFEARAILHLKDNTKKRTTQNIFVPQWPGSISAIKNAEAVSEKILAKLDLAVQSARASAIQSILEKRN